MLEFELGRYKKKVADQQKEIQKLKADIEGYEDSQYGLFAMMTAIVEQADGVTISRDRINEIVENDLQTIVDWNADARTYTLRVWGGETDGEGETNACEQG
jgi:arginyl-tRNA synthetase